MSVPKRASLTLPLLASLAFMSLGLPDGLLGVAWPSIRIFFGLPLDALGALLVAFTGGYVAASFSSGRILARVNLGALLAWSCLATAVSLLGYARTTSWAGMVALAALGGAGAGAIDAGVNTYAATYHGPRMLNWLHACYGVGAATGPLILTRVLEAGHPWQRGYAIVGLAQVGLATAFAFRRKCWPPTNAAAPGAPETASAAATLRLPVTWLGVVTFFLYTGLEASAGVWVYTLFTEGRGIAPTTAGFWVSVYWFGLTVGRLFGALAGWLLPVPHLLRLSLCSIAFGAALIWTDLGDGLSFAGLALAGVASGPIFPSLVAATPARLGEAHRANAIGFQVAAAALGQALLPATIGIVAGRLGLSSIGLLLLTFALLVLVAHELLVQASSASVPCPELSSVV